MKLYWLSPVATQNAGFDINALNDPSNEWLRTYENIIVGMQDPVYFFFPVLERHFLNFLPKRKLIHRDCDRFLKLMDDMIEEKRRIVNEDEGIVVAEKKEDISEKDILTLLLENEKNENDSNTFMTNEELKV